MFRAGCWLIFFRKNAEPIFYVLRPQGEIAYELVGDYSAESFFRVDSSTGEVKIKQDLRNDNLQQLTYTAYIAAYDTAYPEIQSTATVVVQVGRNPNSPQFTPNSYQATLNESVAVGHPVKDLVVADPDGGSVTCAIIGDAKSQEYFEVDSTTCVLRVKKPLTEDPDRSTQYDISIQATDSDKPPSNSLATVTVRVNRDLSAPVFQNLPNTVQVREATAEGSQVFIARAADADRKGEIYYEMIGDYPANIFFMVNKTTGQVIIRNPIKTDSSAVPVYNVRVQAYDSAYPNNRATAVLSVSALRNPSTPAFSSSTYEKTIPDTFTPGTTAVQLTASDADHDKLRFVMEADTFVQQYFYVVPDTGSITLLKSLVGLPANQRQFDFNVLVTDQRTPAKTNRARVVITVDADFPPTFQNLPYTPTVPVNSAVNATVFTVTAIDSSGQVRYRLDGFEPGIQYFFIDPISGQLKVKNSLSTDVSGTRTYTLGVKAYNTLNPDLESTTTITVTVDRNLFSPEFSPRSYFGNANDYDPIGKSLLIVSALDSDIVSPENYFTYSLDPTAQTEYFTVDPVSGILTIKKPLALDTGNRGQYNIRVLATDQGRPSRTATANVQITVARNLNAPEFLTSPTGYRRTVREDFNISEPLIILSARDRDPSSSLNGQFAYSITGPSSATNVFMIDPVSGVLKSRFSLVYTDLDQYTMTVEVRDKGSPSKAQQQTVVIDITRGSNPSFDSSEYIVRLEDTTLPGTVIKQLTALDPVPSGRLQYSITGQGKAPEVFDINPNNGNVTLKRSLRNDTSVSTYLILVEAHREGAPSEKGMTSIRVIISRNANFPVFTRAYLNFTLPEDYPINKVFGQVNATDADIGEGARITYTMQSAHTLFYVNPNSGDLRVISPLTQDTAPDYRFFIRAEDHGLPPKSATATVYVKVNRNSNVPVFTQARYYANISETDSKDHPVIKVSASDPDTDDLSYSIRRNPPDSLYFKIDPSSGQINLAARVNDITTSLFTFTVEVTDNQTPAKYGEAQVEVTVIRNANAPYFTQTSYSVTIGEYTPIQRSIISVSAADGDSPDTASGQLEYTFLESSKYFYISRSNGIVYLTNPLANPDSLNQYNYTVRVADNGSPQKTATVPLTINIVRNQHTPTFSLTSYSATVPDTQAVGSAVLSIGAYDADQDNPYNREVSAVIQGIHVHYTFFQIRTPFIFFPFCILPFFRPVADSKCQAKVYCGRS